MVTICGPGGKPHALSLVGASKGLLDGLSATTHRASYDALAATGAHPVPEHPGHRIITAAGVSAGIDMALHLTALLVDDTAAKAMQL